MSVVTDSINNAVRLNKIGFPEFTTKLVTDVFNAIVSSNITQTQAYLEVLNQIKKDLAKYVEDTRDNISGSDILNFLCKVAPDIDSQIGTYITWNNKNLLTEEQVFKINMAVSIPNTKLNTNVVNTTDTVEELYDTILGAVAARIAADKYELLKETVRLGLSRLIIKGGEIETKLVFETLEISKYNQLSVGYQSESVLTEINTSSILSGWINYSSATKYARVGVSTLNDSNRSTSGTSIQVAGSIKLNFGSDYTLNI